MCLRAGCPQRRRERRCKRWRSCYCGRRRRASRTTTYGGTLSCTLHDQMLIKQLDAGDTVLVPCVGRRGVVVGSAARSRAQRARRRRSPQTVATTGASSTVTTCYFCAGVLPPSHAHAIAYAQGACTLCGAAVHSPTLPDADCAACRRGAMRRRAHRVGARQCANALDSCGANGGAEVVAQRAMTHAGRNRRAEQAIGGRGGAVAARDVFGQGGF